MASCPHCGNENLGMMEGHEIPGEYDGILFWVCLSCGKAWRKHFENRRLSVLSQHRAIEWNQRMQAQRMGETP